MTVELADIVDENDVVIGRAARSEIRARNLLHRATFIVVRDRGARVFIHRRTDDRDVHPGTYDVTVGGLVRSGETYEQAAARELEEELGLTTPLARTGTFRLELPDLRLFAGTFDTVCDGAVRLDSSEIAWGGFVTIEELTAKLDELPFAPGCRGFFDRFLRPGARPA